MALKPAVAYPVSLIKHHIFWKKYSKFLLSLEILARIDISWYDCMVSVEQFFVVSKV